MFIMGGTTDTVYQYTLGTAWDVSTAAYASKSFSVTAQETAPTGLWFKPDGTVMYVVGTTTDSVYQYDLSTAWDVSTASYSGVSYSVVTQETSPQQVNLSADGLKMWVMGSTGDDIWEYTLGTAWNVSTATPVNNFYIGFQAISPTGMFIDSSAANRVFVVDSSQDAVYQYNTATNSAEFNTDKLYTPGALSVNGDFVAGARAYVDGTLVVQGASTLANITANQISTSTSSITLGGAVSTGNTTITSTQTTGLITIGGTAGTGAITLGQSTASQTTNIQAGATASGNTKTLNIGTGGLTGSTTAISIGSTIGTTVTANGTWTYANTISGSINGSAATFTSTTQNSQFNSVGVGTAGSGTAGEIRATNNITAYFSSDRKFKENIHEITSASGIVRAIGGKYFDWTDAYIAEHGGADGYFVQKADFGVIAQDVQRVFPRAVRTRPDGSLAVDYEKLGVLAFPALVETMDRLDALEALVAQLTKGNAS
jgi:hypothetical protein